MIVTNLLGRSVRYTKGKSIPRRIVAVYLLNGRPTLLTVDGAGHFENMDTLTDSIRLLDEIELCRAPEDSRETS
jgi:hypothetical protein